MALRITATPLPYTRRDIMDEYFPELLEQSEQCFKKMEELQKKVVLLLSNSQRQIPDPASETANNLQKMQVQQNLMEYIYLKSLYGFANKLCEIIDCQCRSLAEAKNKEVQEDIDKSKELLENALDIAITVKIDEPLKGMLYLDDVIESQFKERKVLADFSVLKTRERNGSWTFRDITGTIKSKGITQSLWADVKNDDIPIDSNIRPLLDDNEMLRIY